MTHSDDPPLSGTTVGGRVPHGYQTRIAADLKAALLERRSGIVMAPTGAGKSLMICILTELAVALGRPVFILHHAMSLLIQNGEELRTCAALSEMAFGLVVAKGFRGDRRLGEATTENGLCEAVTLGTFGSVRERFGFGLLPAIREFAARGGIIVVDEGEKAAAQVLSSILQDFAEAGCSGYLFSATPFRLDGRDPLEPFGATIGDALIGVAGHNEVLATGRIVPTVFRLAHAEYVDYVSDAMMRGFMSAYVGFLSSGDIPERASEKAFNKFVRSSDPDDVAIAERLVEGVGFMWSRYAKGRRLAMIHCAGVDHAERVAAHVASLHMVGEDGVRRHPRVAIVIGSDCYLMRGRERVAMRDLGRGVGEAREVILDCCRAGEIDVVVNVDALTSGVNIPLVDLTIMASFFRSAPRLKQCSGRGERSLEDGSKADHLLLDLGVSVATLYRGLVMAAAGLADPSRNAMHEVDPRIRRQFFEWLEGDADIPSQAASVERSVVSTARSVKRDDVRHGPAKAEVVLDEAFMVGYCRGLWIDECRRSRPGVSGPAAFNAKTFALFDFEGFGLEGAADALPRFAGVVYDDETNEVVSFLNSDRDEVLAFARCAGCVSSNREWAGVKPLSERQHGFANARTSDGHPQAEGLPAFCADLGVFATRREVAIVADFKGKTLKPILSALLAAIAKRIVDAEVSAPVGAILLASCQQVEEGRWKALAVFMRFAGAFHPKMGWDVPRVVVVDPGERDFAARALAQAGPLVAVDVLPVDEAARKALVSGLFENTVAAWSGSAPPGGPWAFAALGVKKGGIDRMVLLRSKIDDIESGCSREAVDHLAGVFGRMEVSVVDVHEASELGDAILAGGRGRSKGTVPVKALARLGEVLTRKPPEEKRNVWKAFPAALVAPRPAKDGVPGNRGLDWMVALGRFGTNGGKVELLVDFRALRRKVAALPDAEQDKLVSVVDQWMLGQRYGVREPSSRASKEIR